MPPLRLQTVVPCTNLSRIVTYFNRQDVHAALHVVPQSLGHAWDVCSDTVQYTQYRPTMTPYYLALKDTLRILVYSGDIDSCVPFAGTEAAVDGLNLTTAIPYSTWLVNDTMGTPQIAGFFKTYSQCRSLAYATVKGAGHMVPTFKPAQALAMYSAFIAGDLSIAALRG